MDLINLARTSKALRQVLMSRRSMSVWIVARRNATITKAPDPPEDMSEPAWALLLFGPAVCSVRYQVPLAYRFNLELILGSSIALRRTLTGSNLPFVAAYASGVRGESKELFSVTRSDDSNGETYRSLVFSNQFRSQCPDLKECVMSLLPYTKSAISPIPQFSYGPLTRMCSWGMVTRQRRQ